VKQVAINKFKIYKATHIVLWVIWAILTFVNNFGFKTAICFKEIFGHFIAYRVFKWFELIFMFGGGILLLIFLLHIIKNKYFDYLIFELLFLAIIIVHLIMYLYCA
jgi:hypothetical protein